MKHLLLILTFVVFGYFAYQASDRRQRKEATSLITKHGLRLGAVVLLILLLLWAATQLPSTSLI
jgi:preprotein translocase subunit YajC